MRRACGAVSGGLDDPGWGVLRQRRPARTIACAGRMRRIQDAAHGHLRPAKKERSSMSLNTRTALAAGLACAALSFACGEKAKDQPPDTVAPATLGAGPH